MGRPARENPGAKVNLQTEIENLRKALRRAEHIEAELDRRVYYMKTLYDVSMDIFSNVETEQILKAFLMMTMGNFGVMEGLIVLMDPITMTISNRTVMGFEETDIPSMGDWVLGAWTNGKKPHHIEVPVTEGSSAIALALPLSIRPDCCGVLGLGEKLTGDAYTSDDMELLETLSNNLVVAVKNARSFEEIRCLNDVLKDKNRELEDMLNKLRAALRKVEILESVKSSLSKFVPATVCKMIEESPQDAFSSRDQDVSILFLDVEGYTKICEKLDHADLNAVIEKYFSVFMDAIYENNGDVNETAGDGLMVIFHNDDKVLNARDAVSAALSIKQRAASIRGTLDAGIPLVINMGINSGSVLVGAAKFESYTGSRWTYTARGLATNIAARIGALATNGRILISKATAERVRSAFPIEFKGKFKLKNVSDEMDVFEIKAF